MKIYGIISDMPKGVTLGILLNKRVSHPIRLEDPSGRYRNIHLRKDVASALHSYIEGQRITILSIPEGVSDAEVKEALKDPSLSCFEVSGGTMRLVGGRLPAGSLPKSGRDGGGKISLMEAAFSNLEETTRRQIKIATGARSEVTAEDFCRLLDAGDIEEAVDLLSKIVDVGGEVFDLADEKAMEKLSQGIQTHVQELARQISENTQAIENLSMLMACLSLEKSASDLLKIFSGMKGAEQAFMTAAETLIDFFMEERQAQEFILKLARFVLRKKMPEAHGYFERAKAAGVKVGKAKGEITAKELREAERLSKHHERIKAKAQTEGERKAEHGLRSAWHDLLSNDPEKAAALFMRSANKHAQEQFLEQKMRHAADTTPHQADDIYHAFCRLEKAFHEINPQAEGLEAISIYEQQKIKLVFSLLEKLREGKVLTPEQKSVLGESAPQLFGEKGRYRELASDMRGKLEQVSQDPGNRHSEFAGALITGTVGSPAMLPEKEILAVIDQIQSKCSALGEDVSRKDLEETVQLIGKMVNLANQNPFQRETKLPKIINCIDLTYNANPYLRDIAKKAIQDMAPIKPKAKIPGHARYPSYFQLLFHLASLLYREDNMRAADIVNIILQNIPDNVEIYMEDEECSERIEIRAMCCSLLSSLFMKRATKLLAEGKSTEAKGVIKLVQGAAARALGFQRNALALVEMAKVDSYYCRYEESAAAFEEAIAADPAYYRSYLYLSHLYTAKNFTNTIKILDVLSRFKAQLEADFKKDKNLFDNKGNLAWVIPHLAELYCASEGEVVIEILNMLKERYGVETIDAIFLGLVANGTIDPEKLVAPMPKRLLDYFSVPEEAREPFGLTS